MRKHNIAIAVVMLCVAALAILALQLGCRKPQYIPPSQVQIIEQTHNPKIDSLKKLSFLLIDSISKLNSQLAKQKTEQKFSERKAESTIDKLKEALATKDTAKIIVYAEDAANDVIAYKEEVELLDSIQDAIIEKQAATLINNRAEIELHESKFNQLKVAYNIQEVKLSDAARANEKLQKKLKRSKFLNKVLGITSAAGAVLAGIVFL